MPFLVFFIRPSSLTMVLRAHWALLRQRIDLLAEQLGELLLAERMGRQAGCEAVEDGMAGGVDPIVKVNGDAI